MISIRTFDPSSIICVEYTSRFVDVYYGQCLDTGNAYHCSLHINDIMINVCVLSYNFGFFKVQRKG